MAGEGRPACHHLISGGPNAAHTRAQCYPLMHLPPPPPPMLALLSRGSRACASPTHHVLTVTSPRQVWVPRYPAECPAGSGGPDTTGEWTVCKRPSVNARCSWTARHPRELQGCPFSCNAPPFCGASVDACLARSPWKDPAAPVFLEGCRPALSRRGL